MAEDTPGPERRTATLLVIGGTPAGIAAAVRGAREGLDTLLVTRYDHVGGMLTNGIGLETQTRKRRAPILDEFVDGVRDVYRDRYGPDSEQYRDCMDGFVFEPRVAEQVFDTLLSKESNLELIVEHAVDAIERTESEVTSVRLRSTAGDEELVVRADAFVDATYEGDLAAHVGVPYRLGREARSDHDEQFAGRIFTDTESYNGSLESVESVVLRPRELAGPGSAEIPVEEFMLRGTQWRIPEEYTTGRLALRPPPGYSLEVFSGSTGEGDDAIPASNYRVCLSREPGNRRLPEEPEGYDRLTYLDVDVDGDGAPGAIVRRVLTLSLFPNEKGGMNAGDLPGENDEYPTADPATRREIEARHREHCLGLLYFLQNDEAVPVAVRSAAREWGLPLDEFTEDDNFPRQLYVREARRIRGRTTFTENDARVAPGLDRSPIMHDSISSATHALDSHACTSESQIGSSHDGFFILPEVTRPSQVPYRALLPEGVDNLVVPVALSATHVGFSTIRTEPSWMQLGEVAGFAASLANENGTTFGSLGTDALQRELVESGVMISFFNELDMACEEAWLPAVQYLGSKGLFASYNANPKKPLIEPVAREWVRTVGALIEGEEGLDASDRARDLPDDTGGDASPTTVARLVEMLRLEIRYRGLDEIDPADVATECGFDTDRELTRAEGCRVLYSLLSP